MNSPLVLDLFFVLTTLLTLWFLYKISGFHKGIMALAFIWTTLHLFLTYTGFFQDPLAHPERFPLMAGPPVLLIIMGFFIPRIRRLYDQFDLEYMHLVHIVRIPVELCLYWLFVEALVPQIMTFAGRNFDIIAGFSAPLIVLFALRKKFNRSLLIAWNLLCLILLLHIIAIAILSVPLPFQLFGMDQPNIAIMHFPYNWLPSVIVPIVLLSHLISLRFLFQYKRA